MHFKNILLSCVFIFGSLSLSGCYTQLSMFHPDPTDDTEEFYSYSVARVRPNLSLYANDGAGTSLGMAYQMMYNRFSGFMGFGNRYNYYNPYYYGGYYNETYNLGGYTMNIPYKNKPNKPRTWSRDSNSPRTNLNITRTRTQSTTDSNTNNSGHSNSSNVSVTRGTSSSSSSNSSSSGGRRATRRN